MENSREVCETQTHPVEAMCLGDSERDAAASSGHARANAQRDQLAARTDPWDGGPRTGAVPGVGIKIQERGRSVPEFGAVSQPVELVASGVSESALTRRRTSSAMRANASATAPRRRSLRTTATLIVLSNVPASVRPEPGMVEELARRPGPHACGARPWPSPRT